MAGPAKTGNSPKQRQRIRMYNNKKVLPCLYSGPHGKFMSGMIDNNLILDTKGCPIPLKSIGELVWE